MTYSRCMPLLTIQILVQRFPNKGLGGFSQWRVYAFQRELIPQIGRHTQSFGTEVITTIVPIPTLI